MAQNVTSTGPDAAEQAVFSESDSMSMDSSPLDSNPGVGMRPSVLPMYSGQEDGRGRFHWQMYPQAVYAAREDSETAKWALIARRTRVWGNSLKTHSLHSIVVQSPVIKSVLEEVLKEYPGVTVALDRLVFVNPFYPLLHRWPALRKAIDSMEEKRANGDDNAELDQRIQHAKLLDDLLQEEFAGVDKAMKDYKTNGVIMFNDLWMIFEPGVIFLTKIDGEDCAMQLRTPRVLLPVKERVLELMCSFVDFDGTRFDSQQTFIYVNEFKGTKPINALEAVPLEMHSQAERMRAKLIERGGKFESLAGSHFRHYNGLGFNYNRGGMKEQCHVNGRVVIDTFGFNTCNVNQANWFPGINTPATPGYDLNSSEETEELEDRRGHHKSDAPGIATEDFGEGGTPRDTFSEQDREKLSDHSKLLCSPFVSGYALNEKRWLNLAVNDVSDIAFNELAFSDLRLPDEQKDLILGFASSNQSYRNDMDDLIEGKGRGLLVLLCGPPGVGKTLTAESVAEKMKVPLFSLTPGDLGLDSKTIENRLRGLISMCARWGAIILLDEADVLLAQRSHHELERNKVVSVFLRVVEYYEGIMFFTTNRVSTIDEAFQSRIHVSLEYPELDRRRHDVAQANAREKPAPPHSTVAKCSTKRALSPPPSSSNGNGLNGNGTHAAEELHRKLTQPHQVSDREIDKLAELNLNGRQIKNFLKTAQLMAIYKEEALTYKLIDTAVSVTHHFHKAKEANDEACKKIYS